MAPAKDPETAAMNNTRRIVTPIDFGFINIFTRLLGIVEQFCTSGS
jgi:hypothetical protein